MDRKLLILIFLIAALVSLSNLFINAMLFTVLIVALVIGALIIRSRLSFFTRSAALDLALKSSEVLNRTMDARCRAISSPHGVLAFVDGLPQFFTRYPQPVPPVFSGLNAGTPVTDPPCGYPQILPVLDRARSICLYGAQDSGKTTLLCHVLEMRRHEETYIIDPHGYPDKFPHGEIFGVGRNYDEINTCLTEIIDIVNGRYQHYHGQQFTPLNILIDEMTLLHAHCPAFPEFMRVLATESRKVGVRGVFCMHSKRAEFLGLKGGYDLAEDILFVTLRYESGLRYAEIKHADGMRRYALPGPYHSGVVPVSYQYTDQNTGNTGGIPYQYQYQLPAGVSDPVPPDPGVDPTVARIRELRRHVGADGKPTSLNEICRQVYGLKSPRTMRLVKLALGL